MCQKRYRVSYWEKVLLIYIWREANYNNLNNETLNINVMQMKSKKIT